MIARRGFGKFPPELVDRIIDDLRHNAPALDSCSLVSRHWLARSRHHRFSLVFLTPNNFEGFVDLLRSPVATTTIIPYVYTMHFESDEDMDILLEKGLESMACLGHVKTLSIDRCRLDEFGATTMDTFTRIFANIRGLRLLNIRFHGITSAAKFICAYRHLQTLRLELVKLEERPGSQLKAVPLPKSLKVLSLTRSSDLFRWFSSRNINLTRLILRDVYSEDISSISDLLQAAGSSLRYLYFDPLSYDPKIPEAIIRNLYVDANTNLDTVKFLVPNYPGLADSWHTVVLSRINSQCLRKIILIISIEACIAMEAHDWSILDSCCQLSRVAIWLRDFQDLRAAKEVALLVRASLRGCYNRGALRLYASHPWRPSQRPIEYMGVKCYKFDQCVVE